MRRALVGVLLLCACSGTEPGAVQLEDTSPPPPPADSHNARAAPPTTSAEPARPETPTRVLDVAATDGSPPSAGSTLQCQGASGADDESAPDVLWWVEDQPTETSSDGTLAPDGFGPCDHVRCGLGGANGTDVSSPPVQIPAGSECGAAPCVTWSCAAQGGCLATPIPPEAAGFTPAFDVAIGTNGPDASFLPAEPGGPIPITPGHQGGVHLELAFRLTAVDSPPDGPLMKVLVDAEIRQPCCDSPVVGDHFDWSHASWKEPAGTGWWSGDIQAIFFETAGSLYADKPCCVVLEVGRLAEDGSGDVLSWSRTHHAFQCVMAGPAD